MNKVYSEIGKKIRQNRKERKMTQETLADQLGTSSQYIGRIERGLVCPSLKFIYRLASAMECSVYALLPSAYSVERSFLSEELIYRLNHCSTWKKQFIIEFIDWMLQQPDPMPTLSSNSKKFARDK